MDSNSGATKLKGILFDFDGTLVDSLTNATECFNEALLSCGEHSHTPEEIKKHFGTGADRILRQLLQDEKRASAAFDAYKDTMRKRAHEIRLHTGVAELLEILAQEQTPIGIVTGRHEDDLRIVIEPHDIKDQFLTLIADNHVQKSKPDPEGLLLALKKMKLHHHEVMYVGDSVGDIAAAKAAGMVSVAALWDSLASREQLSAAHPDHLARQPQDVWKVFRGSR